MRIYAILVVVSVIFTSLLPAQPSLSRFTFVVEDLGGGPIPEASVQVQHWGGPVAGRRRLIQDGIATTDAQGRVSFELAPSVYEVFASAPAFVPAAASVGDRNETQHVFKLAIRQGGGVGVESPPK